MSVPAAGVRSGSDPQRIVVGTEYVDQITARRSDRRYREAFQRLALDLTAAGERLLDFGSGPGIDARFYAEHGRLVEAYDVDVRMTEYLEAQCGDLIANGAVRVRRGDYREFLAAPAPDDAARFALITANFAPLNLVDDLPALFAKFHALTRPGGAVLASVLSPYFIGDLGYGWWWRNAGRLFSRGSYAVPGAQACIWRRRPGDFARQCAPGFTLEAVFPGNRTRPSAGMGAAAVRLAACRFMFLLFRRGARRT